MMRRDRIVVFLLRRRYLLMALALALAAVMFLAACLPDLLLKRDLILHQEIPPINSPPDRNAQVNHQFMNRKLI